jgi:hypothetical protein
VNAGEAPVAKVARPVSEDHDLDTGESVSVAFTI